MYDLRIDPKLYYHYFISVEVKGLASKRRGQMVLKHGPLKFTNDDVEQMQKVVLTAKNKVVKTSNEDALKMFKMKWLVSSIHGMIMAAKANNCTVHHFSSEVEIDDDYWPTLVELANNYVHERRLLIEAIVSC